MTFPILVPTIVHQADNHWHPTFKESFIAVKTILMEINPNSFKHALKLKPDA